MTLSEDNGSGSGSSSSDSEPETPQKKTKVLPQWRSTPDRAVKRTVLFNLMMFTPQHPMANKPALGHNGALQNTAGVLLVAFLAPAPEHKVQYTWVSYRDACTYVQL
jgi:hypothetical protein